ncbi:MAG TPA: lysophospholipid acyltransferase family protein [Candidatus Paceibacterota bacterium]
MKRLTFFIQALVSIPFRLILFFFVGLRARGLANLQNVDTSSGLIFASNHNNQLDSIILPCALPLLSRLGPVYFVALESKEYTRFPIGRYFYGGWLFKILGAYSFKKGLHNYADSLATHITLLKSGRTVSIYPQGKIVYGDEIIEAHGGVAYLAQASGAPIIPICIEGDKDLHWWQFFLLQRKVKVTFGKSIYFADIEEPGLPEDKRYHAAAQKVMLEIGKLIGNGR